MRDPQNFLILNGVIIAFLVIYFLALKKKTHPTRLNFKNDPKIAKSLPGSGQGGSAIPLNVIFNYNGHSFDAFEVLGVPAGSTLEEISKAYNKNLGNSDPASKAFYVAAYEAIAKSQGK